jgi:hypothetical protein
VNVRILIEFIVDVPSSGVARDVQTRLTREHHARLCEVLTSVMGYEPIQVPGKAEVLVAVENVSWDISDQEWISTEEAG